MWRPRSSCFSVERKLRARFVLSSPTIFISNAALETGKRVQAVHRLHAGWFHRHEGDFVNVGPWSWFLIPLPPSLAPSSAFSSDEETLQWSKWSLKGEGDPANPDTRDAQEKRPGMNNYDTCRKGERENAQGDTSPGVLTSSSTGGMRTVRKSCTDRLTR